MDGAELVDWFILQLPFLLFEKGNVLFICVESG